MPKEVKVEMGPKAQAHIRHIQEMANKKVQVEADSASAYAAEYGASGLVEEPFMRPAMFQLRAEMSDLLQMGGIEDVRKRAEQLVKEKAKRGITDTNLAYEIGNSVQARVIG